MKLLFCANCECLSEKYAYDGRIKNFECSKYKRELKIREERRVNDIKTAYWVYRCQECIEEN